MILVADRLNPGDNDRGRNRNGQGGNNHGSVGSVDGRIH